MRPSTFSCAITVAVGATPPGGNVTPRILESAGSAESAELGEDDRPGIDRKTDQYAQHSHTGGAVMLDHVPEICLQEEGNGSLEEQFVS